MCTGGNWSKANKPTFPHFKLTEWVEEPDMTDEEKSKNPTYKTTGGYLKSYEYKEAWRNEWDSATQEDKESFE